MIKFLFKTAIIAATFIVVGQGIEKYMDNAKSLIDERQARIIAAEWE